MFTHTSTSRWVRELLLAGCFLLLAACGAGADHTAASTSTADGTGADNPPAVIPATPTGLSATAGAATVSLKWAASSNAATYNVKRSVASGGPYSALASPASTTYTDASAANGTTYFYVVSAVDTMGESANSAQASATPKAQTSAPVAPTTLQATAGNAQISLTWTASSGATSYHVKRATSSGGPYTQAATPTSTSFNDASLVNGTTYFYVVSAVDSSGESANSSQASATPSAPVTAPPVAIPPVPSAVKATAGSAQISLSWSASSGATSYHVKRATTSGGPYSQVGSPATTSYADSSVGAGTTYYYVVSALDSAGESANSAQTTATVAASAPTASVSVAGLHVSGNKILNAQNQVVPLHGVDKSGAEYECLSSQAVFDGPSDAQSVTVLQSWSINIVRLPINEDCWLGINGVAVGGTAYQTAIINYVNLLKAANIAAIIDLQWVAPGTTLANQQTPMPDADHAATFWTSVANTFKSNSSVLFDLFNEPYPDSNQDTPAAWACLSKGGTCPGVSYPVASMPSLVNAIRATGATNIIMSPGVQYTNTLDQWLANKPADPTGNLVASWHSYSDQICNNQTCWDSVIKPVMQSVPLIVGEIGERDCQDIYINPLMAYLDANGGNYLAWAWDTYDCSSFPGLITDYSGTPSNFGIGFYDHMLSLAGKTPPPPPAIPMFSSTFPFGIAVGSSSSYTASDGTVYHPDVANSALTESMQFFTAFTTTDTITGTPDPTLYKSGKTGEFGTWTINVPNGTYQVTLGMAPNHTYGAGEYGQDQTIQGQKVGSCVWSTYSGTNVSPDGGTCPQSPVPVPALDAAVTVSYKVSVFNQQLVIEPAASFGGGRTTILNTIKVSQATP
jgi:fibronectin type 3 domain-containing protein